MKLHLHVYRDTVGHSDSTERPGKVCVLRHGLRHLLSCYNRDCVYWAVRTGFSDIVLMKASLTC
jgi:hypothetical protein